MRASATGCIYGGAPGQDSTTPTALSTEPGPKAASPGHCAPHTRRQDYGTACRRGHCPSSPRNVYTKTRAAENQASKGNTPLGCAKCMMLRELAERPHTDPGHCSCAGSSPVTLPHGRSLAPVTEHGCVAPSLLSPPTRTLQDTASMCALGNKEGR